MGFEPWTRGPNNRRMRRMTTARAPGKLMLMGEYAVTQKGHPSVVLAIDRDLTCSLAPSSDFSLNFVGTNIPRITATDWSTLRRHMAETPNLALVHQAFSWVDRYLSEEGTAIPPFRLVVISTLQSPHGVKYGFGSSAALTVAMVAGLYAFASHKPLAREAIFKLASLAHVGVQALSSCADVAAATYGGRLLYRRYDPGWLEGQLHSKASAHLLIEKPWPDLQIVPMSLNPLLSFRVGWTAIPASTPSLMRRMIEFQQREPDRFREFLWASDEAVGQFVQAVDQNLSEDFCHAVSSNREALRRLSVMAAIPIETPLISEALGVVTQVGGCGKTSGAGGGDALIAWLKNDQVDDLVQQKWAQRGVRMMSIRPVAEGVTCR